MSDQLSYGVMRPKLELADTDNKPVQLTIAEVRTQNMAPEGRSPENKLVILFAESFKPAKGFDKDAATTREYVVNSTSYKTLVSKLGRDHDKWTGHPIVMAPTSNDYEGKTFKKLHVAALDQWDKVLAATAKARTASKR